MLKEAKTLLNQIKSIKTNLKKYLRYFRKNSLK